MSFRTIEEISNEGAENRIESWVDDLRGRLPGVMDNVLTHEVSEIVRQFYTKGQVWRQDIGPYDIKAGKEELYLNPVDDNKEVVYVRGVWFKGTPLNAVDKPDNRINKEGTYPIAYYCPYPDVIRYVPIPTADVADEIIVHAVMRPTDPTNLTHEFIVSLYYDVILDGVLGRLYLMPNKPWSNRELGLLHTTQFKKGYLSARNDARRGYTYTSTRRVRFPRWS